MASTGVLSIPRPPGVERFRDNGLSTRTNVNMAHNLWTGVQKGPR